jgi:hypothetical protein
MVFVNTQIPCFSAEVNNWRIYEKKTSLNIISKLIRITVPYVIVIYNYSYQLYIPAKYSAS